MQDPKRLLAIMLAAILSASVLSGAIIAAPLAPVFAQDDDDDDLNDDDNQGSEEQESESEDESEDEKDDESESEAELEVEGNEVKVKVESEGLELDDGLYDATFSCTEPQTSMTFDEAFEVEEGEGKLDVEFQLNDGTYSGCEVALDEPEMTLASFEPFTILAPLEEDDDESEQEHEEETEDEQEKETESKVKLEADDGGIEVEVERNDLGLQDGTYSVTFECAEPALSMSFEDALQVRDGEGEFEAKFALETGTYSDCRITVDNTDVVLADFDEFSVSEDSRVRAEVTEKVKEKRERIISKVQEVRERIVEARQDLPRPFASDLSHTLVATGASADGQAVMAGVNLTAWKSNPAVVIMVVTGGEVEIGDETFSIEIGFALYSLRQDALRVSALAVDNDSGDIVRLVLRGNAIDIIGFPDESGESVDLVFEGNTGPQKNEIAGSELLMEGSLQAA